MTGEQIRALREKMDLPQWKFAEKIGVSQGHLSRLETGVAPAEGSVKILLDKLAEEVKAANAEAA